MTKTTLWRGVARSTPARRKRILSLAATLVLTILSPPPRSVGAGEGGDSRSRLDSLVWMAGCWGSSEGSISADECWLERRGNVMMGFHVDVFENGRVFYEYLRIVAEDDTMTYMASPMGGEATPFVLTETSEQRVVFENPNHDWPQRLTYWREDNRLHAQAEGLDASSRKANWVWQRRADPGR